LLAAALLLPVVQAAATWHVLSAGCVDRAGEHDKPSSSHPLHCDFCLTVAGLIGGAATGVLPATPHPAGSHEAAPVTAGRVLRAPVTPALATRTRPGAGRTAIGYAIGTAGYALGLALSALFDLPSGAVVVWALALFATLAALRLRSESQSPAAG
jgi:hypothetical protein